MALLLWWLGHALALWYDDSLHTGRPARVAVARLALVLAAGATWVFIPSLSGPWTGDLVLGFVVFFCVALVIAHGPAWCLDKMTITPVAIAFRHFRTHEPIDTCTACGYCLRGLTESRCPECGTYFDPEQRITTLPE